MTIAKYCKDNNLSKEEYTNFRSNIVATAKEIFEQLEETNGVYKEMTNIFPGGLKTDIDYFVLTELKKLGLEAFEDNTLYRIN